MKYILTIDEGTTSTRALLISSNGKILDIVQKEIRQIYPQPGWVEHDPVEIWEKTLAASRELITKVLSEKKISAADISGIAITNQRETTIIWDKNTGKPIYNAIVWQCRRTTEICAELKKSGLSDLVKSKTGLIIDSYFSASKIKWILNNHHPELEGREDLTTHTNLIFGTIDTWLIWNLTKEHLTEASNASRTMLYNIHENKWDEELISKLNIPQTLLPKVVPSNANFGSTNLFKDLLNKELPILAVLGDQQAAAYAYNNETKITYGTGTFIMMPANNSESKNLLMTSAYKTQSQKALALEGSVFVGGSIVQWLRDGLEIISSSSEIEDLANSVPDNGGVYLIPALAGLGAPFWREDVNGTIFGITRATTKAHIARAALESIAYRVRDIFEVLDSQTRQSITSINVDGGASKNNLLMQFQADLLQIPIKRYTETEMTALGAARMTGEVELKLQSETIFKPQRNLDKQYKEWQSYISKLL